MTYLALKYAHILGAIVILGTGTGIAFFMVMAHRSADPDHIGRTAATVVVADRIFILTAVIVQPITGILLAQVIGFPLDAPWLLASLGLYVLAGAFWLPVLWMQARMRDLARQAAATGGPLPARYHQLYRTWFCFGFPGFGAVAAILWLMIAKPSF